jgi:hypothetical protein
MSTPAAPRNVLLTVGAVCLGTSFLPIWSTVKTSPPAVERHIFTVGVPSDAWFRHVNERRDNADQSVFMHERHWKLIDVIGLINVELLFSCGVGFQSARATISLASDRATWGISVG